MNPKKAEIIAKTIVENEFNMTQSAIALNPSMTYNSAKVTGHRRANNPDVLAAIDKLIPYDDDYLRQRARELMQSKDERVALGAVTLGMKERRLLVDQVADVTDRADELEKAAEEAMKRIMGDTRQRVGLAGGDMGDMTITQSSSSQDQVE